MFANTYSLVGLKECGSAQVLCFDAWKPELHFSSNTAALGSADIGRAVNQRIIVVGDVALRKSSKHRGRFLLNSRSPFSPYRLQREMPSAWIDDAIQSLTWYPIEYCSSRPDQVSPNLFWILRIAERSHRFDTLKNIIAVHSVRHIRRQRLPCEKDEFHKKDIGQEHTFLFVFNATGEILIHATFDEQIT